jgi:hypothetical protein
MRCFRAIDISFLSWRSFLRDAYFDNPFLSEGSRFVTTILSTAVSSHFNGTVNHNHSSLLLLFPYLLGLLPWIFTLGTLEQ